MNIYIKTYKILMQSLSFFSCPGTVGPTGQMAVCRGEAAAHIDLAVTAEQRTLVQPPDTHRIVSRPFALLK